jgi:hypothetical protein
LSQNSLIGFDSVRVNPSACASGTPKVAINASIPSFVHIVFIDGRAWVIFVASAPAWCGKDNRLSESWKPRSFN